MISDPNHNTGHGHVFPRPDGVRMRCGGPGICKECALDLARKIAVKQEAKAVQSHGFAREERYIVVKLKHLRANGQESAMREWLRNYQIPTVDCLVVEHDWPEYEPTWAAIKARVVGEPDTTQPKRTPPRLDKSVPDSTVRCASCDAGIISGEAFDYARECCEAGKKFDIERTGLKARVVGETSNG
jgi:hypothetical protein